MYDQTIFRFSTCLFFVVFFLFYSIPDAWAQATIRGKVTRAESAETIQGVTIRLINEADSVVNATSSSSQGTYQLRVPKTGEYTLRFLYMGMATHDHALTVSSDRAAQQVDVALHPSAIELESVEVRVQPEVRVMQDTTEFNASAFTTEAYADADALIGQLPGVEIDGEGNVIAQGEEVTRILVDGKEFFSTDPRIAMKNLPADIIDKVQLIDEQNEQSRFSGVDDGERRKVINIVTKPDRRRGYFGRAGSALGNLTRYNLGGRLSYFNQDERISFSGTSNNINQGNFGMADIGADSDDSGGRGGRGGNNGGGRNPQGHAKINSFSLNYNNAWLDDTWELSGDYSFNHHNSLVHSTTNRETLIGNNANQRSFENADRDRINRNHRLNMQLEWEGDSVHMLTFRPRLTLQQTNGLNVTRGTTHTNLEELINSSSRELKNEQRNVNFSGTLDYRIRLGRAGRVLAFNTSANLNRNKGMAQNISLNEYFLQRYDTDQDTVNNQNLTETLGNGWSGRLSYSEPLDSFHRVSVNYSLRNNSNSSDRQTLDFLAETGQYSELNRQLSNTFDNDYLYHSSGLGYQFSKNSFHLNMSINYQNSQVQNHRTFPTETQLDRRFESYLPSMSIQYRPSRNFNFRISYRTSTNAPSVNQLQDVINNQNPTHIRTGNAGLEQEYEHRFEGTLRRVDRTSGKNLNISLNGSFSNNRVVNSTMVVAADTLIAPGITLRQGGQFTQPVNVDGYYTMRGNVSYGTPIKKWKLNLNLNTGLHHSHSIGLINHEKTFSDTYGVTQRISVNSRISEKLLYNISYSGSYSIVHSSVNTRENYNYLNQTLRNDLTWIFWKGIRFNSSLIYNKNSGLSQGYDQSFFLWNVSIGKKLMNRQQAELALSAYDVLNRNQSIRRNVTERYITDVSSNTLQQYFMLSFTYNLRHFGGGGGGAGNRQGRF